MTDVPLEGSDALLRVVMTDVPLEGIRRALLDGCDDRRTDRRRLARSELRRQTVSPSGETRA
jgi:hypothetical protein